MQGCFLIIHQSMAKQQGYHCLPAQIIMLIIKPFQGKSLPTQLLTGGSKIHFPFSQLVLMTAGLPLLVLMTADLPLQLRKIFRNSANTILYLLFGLIITAAIGLQFSQKRAESVLPAHYH